MSPQLPDISLLKRPPSENMVALYLLDIARERLANPDLANQIHAQLLVAANQEYAKAIGAREAVLPIELADRIRALREALAK